MLLNPTFQYFIYLDLFISAGLIPRSLLCKGGC